MTVPIPEVSDFCWPVDTSCIPDFDDKPQDVRDVAMALAGQTMRMLTGYSVGGCPVDLRPCASRCVSASEHWYADGGTFVPYIGAAGAWMNACGCSTDCACSTLSEITLPVWGGYVEGVSIDGDELPPTAWRVDRFNSLVRLDGEAWPTCQDMSAMPGDEGSFVVRYRASKPVDAIGALAAGMLAAEYVKACEGKGCALPLGTKSVVRQGVSVTITPGSFPDGVTNIAFVDAYIAAHNPFKLKAPPAIYSPDMKAPRFTTQGGV